MGIEELLKPRQGKNGLTSNGIAAEVKTFTDKILSHETFAGLGPALYDLLKIYDTSEAIHKINEALAYQKGARPQTELLITEIPPEGIIIEKPGHYSFSPLSHTSLGGANTIIWAPDIEIGAAITIVSDGVILDLAGVSLEAKIQDSSQHLVGIFVFGASNVTIQNGALTSMCLYGIQAELVENLSIKNINVSGLEYRNQNIRAASPTGIQVNMAKNVTISDCQLQYFYVSADSCSGIELLNTLGGTVENCTASNLFNYAGLVCGYTYGKCTGITTKNCHADGLQSHFGGNIRTGGHTVLGFMPLLCFALEFDDCSSKNIIGSCDDCHGMSVFINADVKVNNFHADTVTDGVTQFNTGAKATGLEIYGVDVQANNCTVNNVRAINPQNRVSTGFSVWGMGISLSNCTASNVSVSNDLDEKSLLMGTGTGFGWAPDPRLCHIAATAITYTDCTAINCQVGFDTWNHIDGTWHKPTYENCAINILVEPGGERTVYGAPLTECNPPVAVSIHNQAKHNHYPGAPQSKPAIGYAYPTGNINGLSLPYALSHLEGVNAQWWFYVGLLQDNQGADHSFELNFIEPGGQLGDTGLTAVDFDFTFSNQGYDFHATSTFGGEDPLNIVQSIINTVGFGTVESQNKTYGINVNSLTGSTIKVEYDVQNSQSSASMFTGQIGQPGAAYIIKGQGSTWLWKCPTSGKGEVAPYQYEISVELVDERGLVPEGLGSYVGIDPMSKKPSDALSSVEYAQPRLKVKGWSITLTRHTECWPLSVWEKLEGFASSYNFQGCGTGTGQLWLDRQALFEASVGRHSQGRSSLAQVLADTQKTLDPQQMQGALNALQHKESHPNGVQPLANHIKQLVAEQASLSAAQNKQLYQGCWLPVSLDAGPYAGSTLLFVSFWNEAKPVANYDTDNGDAQPNSFMNLYTGLLGPQAADTHSAYTISDLLNPAAAADGAAIDKYNYRIQFTEQFQSICDVTDPQRWASEIQVTVKANSQARFALAAYAMRAGREEVAGIDKDLVFTLKTLSPNTHTTMISSAAGAPIYEGASRIYDEQGQVVGSGWVEQMVGSPAQ